MGNMNKNQFLFLDNWLWGAKLIRGMSEWLIEDIKSSTGFTLRLYHLIGGPAASIWFLFLIFGGLSSFFLSILLAYRDLSLIHGTITELIS